LLKKSGIYGLNEVDDFEMDGKVIMSLCNNVLFRI